VSIGIGIERTDEFTAADGLLTDVEVREGERTIGVGTHERRVIDRTGFGS
jgi:predicted thioesterase